jgi:uroporphyrinogen-III synthase
MEEELHMAETRRRGPVVFMAVVYHNVAYVLDAHPDELARCRRELGTAIRGVFTSSDEAAAVVQACRRPCRG